MSLLKVMFPTPDTHLYDKCGASPVTFGLKDLNPTNHARAH